MSRLEWYVADGLEKGWDVSWFFKEEWDDPQLFEIQWALRDKTSLELWAKKCYKGKQMLWLRLGIKLCVDVSQYLDPNLSADEMEKVYYKLLKEKQNELS